VDPGWCDKLDAVAKKVKNIFPERVAEGFKISNILLFNARI
jgi:hypothetical protein